MRYLLLCVFMVGCTNSPTGAPLPDHRLQMVNAGSADAHLVIPGVIDVFVMPAASPCASLDLATQALTLTTTINGVTRTAMFNRGTTHWRVTVSDGATTMTALTARPCS